MTVIDDATNNTTTIATGAGPFDLAVDPATNMTYVANYLGGNITVIDNATDGTTTRGYGSGGSLFGGGEPCDEQDLCR